MGFWDGYHWTDAGTETKRQIARPNSSRLMALMRIALVAIFALIGSVEAFNPASSAASQPTEDPAQKAADLRRAIANHGVSPDRVIIIYDHSRSSSDSIRVTARGEAGGRLLYADDAIGRDVLRVPNRSAVAVANRIRKLPGVRDAYPDRVASISMSVNDPYYRNEWGLSKIQAGTAWDTSQGNGVKVAVLDCGIHASHPDLAGKVVLDRNFSASSSTDDLCNHGTHVAGTIAAVTNNGVGIAAVAPGGTLLNGKVLGDSGSGMLSDVDTGIEWAADNGAKVISMSLGANTPCPTGTQFAATYVWNKGVVLVAAAGNSYASGAMAPANCQNVIGVAATDSKDAKASFSNYGPEVDVAAPGVGIESTVNPNLNGGKAYASFSGTSMATPHAAGVLALIWAMNSGAAPASIRDRLFSTADRIAGTGTLWTYGRIDAASAVASDLLPRPPAPTALVAIARSSLIRLSWTTSAAPDVTYTVYRGTSLGGPKAAIATGQSRNRYTDRNVVTGQLYCYQVTARNASGESVPSPEACSTLP